MLRKSVIWLALGLSLAMTILAIGPGRSQMNPPVPEYWIKAEEILWDYAPSFPINEMRGKPFNEEQLVFVGDSPDRIGHIYRKAVFRSYTRDFGEVIDGPNEVVNAATGQMTIIRQPGTPEEHLGILGPIIRAEVGDRIVVHFKNETSFQQTIHPHGVFYAKDSEGTPYMDGTSVKDKQDDGVPPGGVYTYNWLVPERAGPGPDDPNSIGWLYHSHADEIADTNAGLVGAIIIYKQGTLDRRTGLPRGVDREFVNLFNVFDENVSLFAEANMEEFVSASVDPEDENFAESNLMHAINGLVYTNLKGLTAKKDEKIRWYLLSIGTEVDIHTPHWHGETLLERGKRVDVTEIFPASSKTLDMLADDPGVWMYHCHVNDHLSAGMMTVLTVQDS